MRRSVDEFGQSIVMVTHDPIAASHADSVVFLADGRIVDEVTDPTADRVLDRIKAARGLRWPVHIALRNLGPTSDVTSAPSSPSCSASRSWPARSCSATPSATNFDDLFSDANAGTDVVVRGEDTRSARTTRPARPGLDRLGWPPCPVCRRAVAVPHPGLASSSAPTARRSAASGPPTRRGAGSPAAELNPYRIVEGRAPPSPTRS